MNSRPLVPIMAVAALGLAAVLPLQAQPAPAPTAPVAPVAPAVSPAPTASADAKSKEVLSVDFPDDDIRAILRNVADLFELNVIMPESLKGKATIKLRDVTWRQIFDNLLKPVGYTYVEEGNIIKVVSNEALQQEPMMTDVFTLNYAKAADIAPTITSLIDGVLGKKAIVEFSDALEADLKKKDAEWGFDSPSASVEVFLNGIEKEKQEEAKDEKKDEKKDGGDKKEPDKKDTGEKKDGGASPPPGGGQTGNN